MNESTQQTSVRLPNQTHEFNQSATLEQRLGQTQKRTVDKKLLSDYTTKEEMPTFYFHLQMNKLTSFSSEPSEHLGALRKCSGIELALADSGTSTPRRSSSTVAGGPKPTSGTYPTVLFNGILGLC